MKHTLIAIAVAAATFGSVIMPSQAAPTAPVQSAVTSNAGNVMLAYYYRGHYYPYRYHGHYYPYRYHGHYYPYRYHGHYYPYRYRGRYYRYRYGGRYYMYRYGGRYCNQRYYRNGRYYCR